MGQFHKIFVIAGLCLGVLAVNPGIAQACVSPTGVTGEVIYSSARDVFQGCTTNGWTAFHTQNRTPAATCLNPAATPGEIVYKSAYNAFMGCTLAGWQAFNAPLDPCAPANPEVGAGCLDGTIYVGKTPDGNVKMFTTASPGVGREWNTGNSSNYVDVGGLVNCTTGAQASCNTGRLNTPIIAAADSSTDGGVQPHNAALYCQNLVAHGYSDWYLPAYHELAMLYTARNSGVLAGSFPTVSSFPSSLYWSSSEYSGIGAMQINFATGGGYPFNAGANVDKRWPFTTRCVRNSQPPPSMVGHWTFDDGTGSAIAIDSTMNGNTGTLTNMDNMAAWATGQQGSHSLHFDGANDVVIVPGSLSLDNLYSVTISAWLYKNTSATNPRIVDKRQGAGNDFIFFIGASNRLTFEAWRWSGQYGSWAAPINSVPNNQWVHVAVTYDYSNTSNAALLYINGLPVTATTMYAPSGTLSDSGSGVSAYIGNAESGNRGIDGRIDDLRIYNYVLSPSDIQTLATP